MSNHPRRRWRGKHEHRFDQTRPRKTRYGRLSGTQRRRQQAIKRRAHVHAVCHHALGIYDPRCGFCRLVGEIAMTLTEDTKP